jgi:hypothetical protein
MQWAADTWATAAAHFMGLHSISTPPRVRNLRTLPQPLPKVGENTRGFMRAVRIRGLVEGRIPIAYPEKPMTEQKRGGKLEPFN